MAIRDILVTLIVFGSLPFFFWRPYIGVLVWSWLSYMNPHRLAWGFAYDMPFAQIVALTLFVAIIFSNEKIKPPKEQVMFVWALYLLWMGISTYFAIFPDDAMLQFIKVVKIQVITFLTLVLITDREKLDHLIWVIVLSIGYYSVKGGVFTLVTGGGFRVYGAPESFIQENNALALATLMIIPLMIYLHRISAAHKWVQVGLVGAILLSTVSVVGSQSRGAFVAIIAVSGYFWLKSKNKLPTALAMVLMGLLVLSFMPQSWHERMSSISNYEQDASAMGRINAWTYSLNVANDNLTGAGFESWSEYTFSRYAPNPRDVHAAHSIYFGPLADHGWPGLILFVLILYLAWRTLVRVESSTKVDPALENDNLLSRMLQVSFIAYFSGGAFLSLAYFDLPWHMIVIAILMKRWLPDSGQSSAGIQHNSMNMLPKTPAYKPEKL